LPFLTCASFCFRFFTCFGVFVFLFSLFDSFTIFLCSLKRNHEMTEYPRTSYYLHAPTNCSGFCVKTKRHSLLYWDSNRQYRLSWFFLNSKLLTDTPFLYNSDTNHDCTTDYCVVTTLHLHVLRYLHAGICSDTNLRNKHSHTYCTIVWKKMKYLSV
jgi:hypothetical protein